MKRVRDSVSDMAAKFAEQEGMDGQASRALSIVIMSKPVR